MTNRFFFVPLASAYAVALIFSTASSGVSAEELNLYNWSDNIADDTVLSFEKQTGIHTRYDVYDSDETLQAKLLAGSSGYDVVVPSSAYAGKQIQAGVYQKLDKSKIPNLVNLDPVLMKIVAGADPGNQYTVPWSWGTDGLGYNATKIKETLGKDAPLDSWDLLFDPKYVSKLKHCGVSVLDSPEDAFAAGLVYLHKDQNSRNPADYQAVYELYRTIRPYITQFNSSGYINDLANNDICLALSWSGDVAIAKKRAIEAHRSYEIGYSIPKGDGILWFDLMAVPKDAPHAAAAMQWINFILQPKVSASITNQVFYPNANKAGLPLVKAEIRDDVAIYPPPERLRSMTVQAPPPADIVRLQTRLWAQIKTGR
ncbi:polyamine ABC transporter substrate-binding protein [Burkholderia ubonensis]|uniref:polyamine ABC transporter substrate-binding protein n=1 Tax=Burkholderia ubonensis TaxID=101571 RepID=UPI000BA5A8C3|nr:polyamine ABC transporter substrate-binding protein [Burkholderia ubonensis]PAJ85365.1 polyamine ABC transporter substrate-binding protein [Burkholderia ubonensis]PAJ92311.1 polyamine ABC transporter substrate-binding protein [Burkholderia ubonensis]PAK05667.1 polyamine ABC transporter substrate-binding protein [Burkholderia ubonensis]PAK14495.1 polyamine ABC transporter substrate-binding protein [Burkholderia ubonensis]RQP67649.1 polyamine ABC transporter substrate-binding protein [Burkhol